jgi:hypothetical protein
MNKSLKFIHITKTGGTSIEDCAISKQIQFGRFHHEYASSKMKTFSGKYHMYFPMVSTNVKNKYDWFMVVRDPYDRIISECHCKWGGGNWKQIKHDSKRCSADQMNKYIQMRIRTRTPHGYHYSEQYKYLDDSLDIQIHVLKFENLKEEFDALMEKYNIDVQLDVHHNQNNKRFSVKDFSKETIDLINVVYEPDFRLFGYKMI